MAGRSYTHRTIKILFGTSAGLCAFPDCRLRLIDGAFDPADPAMLANIAHIRGLADEGPRADPTMTLAERNHHTNLMLLCPTHHTSIDTEPDRYPSDVLQAYKVRHERWVNERLTAAIPQVTFAELDIVCKHLVKNEGLPSTALRSVPPDEKMRHNGLGSQSVLRLTLGLALSPLVATYLQKMTSAVDEHFAANLCAGFVREYEDLWQQGMRGDTLFVALSEFAGGEGGGVTDFKRQAAGLAVLAHLFQICDVFEEVP